MYIKANNEIVEKYPYSIGQLRKDNPNTSFPKNLSDSLLAEWGVFPCTIVEQPFYDPLVSLLKQDTPQLVGSNWAVGWVVENIPLEDAKSNVRNTRNCLLAESDWTQVADAPVNKAAWATYRQALRDITAQEGFPFNVTFPTQPTV